MQNYDTYTLLTYQSMTFIVNNQKVTNEMNRNNKCYEVNDEIGLNICSLGKLIGRRENHREKLVNEWTHQGKNKSVYDIYIPVIDPSQLSYIYIYIYIYNVQEIYHMYLINI